VLADLNRRGDRAREGLYGRDRDDALDLAVLDPNFCALSATGRRGRSGDGSAPLGLWQKPTHIRLSVLLCGIFR